MKGEAHEKTGAKTTERKTAKTASRKTATRGVAFADFISEAVPGLRRDCPSGGEKDLRKMCRQTQENRGALVYALWKKLQEEAQYCPECRERERTYVRGRALYEYASAAPSIYRFIYGNRREYGAYFGEEMAEELGSFIRKVEPDGLIPIPLHWKRLRSRGYNQAQILAEEIGRLLQIPVYSKLLKRGRNTVPMKKLNGAERQNNLKRAFNVAGNDVKLKRVIIVDDIYTTGTTIEEAARVLKKAGVEEVYFVTLSAV